MGFIFNNFSWKLLSLVVAFGLWFMVMSANSIEISKEVALDIDAPPGLVVANEVPDHVTFRLTGSKFFLRTLANSMDMIKVDLTKAKAGPTYYRIEKESMHLPIGVKILSISPSTINPVLEPVARRSVPVEPVLRNKVPPGFRLVKVQPMPQSVHIQGPKTQVDKVSAVKSLPIDLSELPPSLKWDVPLSTGVPNIAFDEEIVPKVVVEVEPTGSNFRVAGVPVKVEAASRKFSLSTEKVSLYVNCPPGLIKSLTPERVHVVLKVPETKPGTYVRELNVDLPRGVRLVRVVPDRVQVQVE